MESAESSGGRPEPVAMNFPANSPAKVPRRIKRRLLEARNGSSPPSSVEEIEAKLKEADLRRKQFHDWLSYKARPKPKSPSWSSQEEDLGQRLEAKLNAAEQKRLEMLEKAQRKLARLDEQRQAARSEVESRMEKEREALESRVESRVRKAEQNRIRLLTASVQRRAALRERTARSLFQRTVRENRYKERVRSAMRQKRAAAEKKRLELLEAEKGRAHARVMRARKVAKVVCTLREIERQKKEQQLLEKLQRAKDQREEYLKQRGSPHGTTRSVWTKQGDLLSRKLARCWRRFVRSRRTTYSLAKSYETLKINSKSVKSMPFDHFALLINSPLTLQSTKLFLDRLETRFALSLASSAPQNIDHLLKHIGSPKKPRKTPTRMTKNNKNVKNNNLNNNNDSRYSVRVVLCAYMILGHPHAVFSARGEREISLVESASEFVKQFELLLDIILNGKNGEKSFKGQLAEFDSAWCNYLYRFVAWKVKDARALEEDLVRAACKLELSMIQTCKVNENGETPELSHDMKAIQKQVTEDQKLLREKVHHLSGLPGLERMESALTETRSKFFESKDKTSTPLVAHIASPPDKTSSSSSSSSSSSRQQNYDSAPQAKSVVRSLFGKGVDGNSRVSRGGSGKTPSENEVLVNEMLHESNGFVSDSISSDGESEIKGKVKEAMEKAFWDGVMETLKGENPDYTRVLSLVKEVRDELCDLAPQSWKNEIIDSIDLDILSQVLGSGLQDGQYLGQILEFSLGKVRELSSAANEEEMKVTHAKLLKELAQISVSAPENEKITSFVLSLVKGLRFTLEEIQKLKREVSKARIQMLEPLLQGKAGIEYLQKAFSERYGPHSDASDNLPLTASWISDLSVNLEQEWGEYVNSLSSLSIDTNAQPIVATLRTGGALSVNQAFSHPNTSSGGKAELPECNGDIIDKTVRLGLLKLASGVQGVTVNSVPEMFKLNALRLRSVQSEYQKIIVIATSVLVLRQIIITEKFPYSETSVLESVQKLMKLIDSSADVGIAEIVETLINSSENLQNKKELITRVLLKSLQNGDVIFNKVSSSIYTAFKAVVLAGNGMKGRKLAELALKKVGGVILLDRVVKAGEVLVKMAVLSREIHGPWYSLLVHEEI